MVKCASLWGTLGVEVLPEDYPSDSDHDFGDPICEEPNCQNVARINKPEETKLGKCLDYINKARKQSTHR